MGQKFQVEDEPDLTIPEDTIVRARLSEVKPKQIEWQDRTTGEKKSKTLLEFWFEVISDNQYRGRKIKGECDAKLSNHPNNRFRNWSESLLGRELPVGMGIDTDDIVGLTADITVKHEVAKDKSRVFERLDEVIPVSGGFDVTQPPF